MRVLLDECVDERLRHSFAPHLCETCRYAGFKGLANGRLLAAAEHAGFDVLITVDRKMPNQQNLAGRRLALVVLDARAATLEDLLPLMPDVLGALEMLRPGEVIQLSAR